MRGRTRGWRVPFAAVALLLIAGCGVNTQFVYKPNAPAVGVLKLPVKLAVLPFKDGTEDFTERGSFLSGAYSYNLAKAGKIGAISALPPNLWAKIFADDMTASGGFQMVRFIYSSSELADEEFYIEGTLEKAYTPGEATERPSEFAFGLRAVRCADNRLVWEKEVTRVWKTSISLYEGCGWSRQCYVDLYHADINRAVQGMFAEARADLMATLASLAKGRMGDEWKDKENSTPQDPDSVERTIDRILKGK